MDSIFVILAAVVTAAFVATAILLVGRRAGRSAFGTDGVEDRLQQLDTEVAALREAKAEADRRLAAEEQKAARIPTLERELGEARTSLDALRDVKAALDRELARASANADQDAQTLTTSRARLAEVEANLRDAVSRTDTIRDEKADLEKAFADIRARLGEKTETAEGQRNDLAAAQEQLASTRKELAVAREENSRLQEQLSQEMKQAEDKLNLLKEAKEQMGQQFRVLAEEVMSNHGEAFAKQNKEQISGLLTPLKDRLVEFQQGLQSAQTDSAKERANLGAQIRTLTETSVSMTRETHNLTQALKGKVQTQGAWGEMILGTILERSGLRNGEEYVTQESHATDDGGRLRPDVLINLPNGERLVIDSKVSLTAFESYVNAEDDAARTASLSRHLTSIRSHIKSLSAKEYQQNTGNGLNFVIMFIPIEGALAVALQQDPALTAFAAEAHVAIATPTTLMMALRTIASLWHVERRNQNAEAIAERAGKLYDKFVGFVGDLQTLGKRLGQAQASYGDAVSKLSTGPGNLVRQVETLKGMGARTAKSLPSALVDSGEPPVLVAPTTSGTGAQASQAEALLCENSNDVNA